MVTLIKALQVLLALSILIIVHEFGHFFFAKLFKIRVEKFYLFFDIKGVTLWKWKPKNSETEYGIGWLPLGGYCKISGMVDESMDTDQLAQEPKPWEFRTKPAWQRLLVMAGGVLFNFILAILLYISILGIWGETYISNEENCIWANELAQEMGFESGDHIIAFDDYHPENFSMLQIDLARRNVRKAVVKRGEDTLDLYIDQNMISEVINSPGMFDLAVPFVIDQVVDYGANAGSDLASGDRVIAIDSVPVRYMQESRGILSELRGQNAEVTVIKATGDTAALTLAVDSLGRLGVYNKLPGIKSRTYNCLEAIPAGFKLAGSSIGSYLQDLKLVFTPRTEAYKSVGSFITIGQIFPSKWNWYSFINILAMLSVMLGVMNLLPIPALDGGHIVLTIYEMVTRKKPSEQLLMVLQKIGLYILIFIMILAFSNDILRLFK